MNQHTLPQRFRISYVKDNSGHYPINRLRNVAINNTLTSHFWLTDIDIWPACSDCKSLSSVADLVRDSPFAACLPPLRRQAGAHRSRIRGVLQQQAAEDRGQVEGDQPKPRRRMHRLGGLLLQVGEAGRSDSSDISSWFPTTRRSCCPAWRTVRATFSRSSSSPTWSSRCAVIPSRRRTTSAGSGVRTVQSTPSTWSASRTRATSRTSW